MCIKLYIHNTSRQHDTRFLSVINPATGYTVYSPFQDPYVKLSPCQCPIPHTHPGRPHPDILAPHEVCLWHAPCCHLEILNVCRLTNKLDIEDDDPESCQSWTKYHHFCETAEGREDRSFLSKYFLSPPHPHHNTTLLPFAAHFFKSGVEFALANRYHGQVVRRLQDPNMHHAPMHEKQALARQLAYFDRVSRVAVGVLAQFAMRWDASQNMWPARPGRARYPTLNAFADYDALRLRAASWARDDVAPVAWPHGEKRWNEFDAMLPFPRDDPSVVPWCFFPSGTGAVPQWQQGGAWERFPREMLDPALFEGEDKDEGMGARWSGMPDMFAGEDNFEVDPNFDFSFGLGDMAPPNQWDSSFNQGMQTYSMGEQMDVDMTMDMPPVLGDIAAAHPDVALPSIEVSPSPTPSSPLSSSFSVCSSTDNDDGMDEGNDEDSSDDSDDDSDDEDKEYPVECLVDHKPRRGPRAGVKHYRVRWAGNWPARQKETWQPRANIAPQVIRQYWQQFDRERGGKKGSSRGRWGGKGTGKSQ
ncbi:hypothetical protein F4810DRAFT_633619 [Camillea tinctor]|nr:hypothetical protein F4810DRAFT_633619 [Camillea tinctor]